MLQLERKMDEVKTFLRAPIGLPRRTSEKRMLSGTMKYHFPNWQNLMKKRRPMIKKDIHVMKIWKGKTLTTKREDKKMPEQHQRISSGPRAMRAPRKESRTKET